MLDSITTYLITLLPAASSVIGMIATLIVAVKKIKKSNIDTASEVKEMHEEIKKEKAENNILKTQLQVAIKANSEIARELSEIKSKLNKVHIKKGE